MFCIQHKQLERKSALRIPSILIPTFAVFKKIILKKKKSTNETRAWHRISRFDEVMTPADTQGTSREGSGGVSNEEIRLRI